MLIKVSIVEDDPATRENLMVIINRSADLTGMETYSSAEDAIRGVPKNLPDVLLVDINLGRRSGIECVAYLRRLIPSCR